MPVNTEPAIDNQCLQANSIHASQREPSQHQHRYPLPLNVDIYPAAYSSPVDNLNNHYFNIFKAEPVDGCTVIAEPKIDRPADMAYSYLVVIDGDAGLCGMKRKMKMAKDVGAKGIIILSE